MATSLLALLDDIASVLDDVALLTKVATKKTAGVLGDDLALNAQQVTGVSADRELPVVFAVGKGSAVNKAILIPAALAISAFIPWAVTPLLMLGGAFLCFEGFEKLWHKLTHRKHQAGEEEATLRRALEAKGGDLKALERDKVKGAVRTDFVLSAEIVTITLGTVANEPFLTQLAVLVGIGILMTVGVYGFVAGIVKLDDVGLFLSRRKGGGLPALGRGILATAPWLMKGLAIAGTVAMFLVGGGILAHGIPPLHHLIESLTHRAGGLLGSLVSPALNGLVGLLAGALTLALVLGVKKVWPGRKQKVAQAPPA